MDSNQVQLLSKIISSVHALSVSSYRLIFENCVIKHYPKSQNITQVAVKNISEYFLLDGVLHRYNINDEGESVTTGFYFPLSVITPNFARTSAGRSMFFLQTLTEVTTSEIEVSIMDNLRNEYNDIRIWGHKIIQSELAKSFEREINFRSHSARQRLIDLRQEFPNLENLVPHTCIASYLGITPVSFSRLRHELAKSR